MKCDVCKEAEAKVHLTQIVNGVMQKIDLCEPCAKAKGVSDPTGFSLADLLLGMGQGEITGPITTASEKRCPACGMTQNDFKKSGRLGCPKCYETFAEALAALIKSMHKGSQHVGKRLPISDSTDKGSFRERLKTLRHELEQAISSENFETAAELRDLIRKLEEGIRPSPKG